ncbi:hypothetical protein [Anaerotruncus sp. 1XD42-93]|uniref:DUF7211 domain-containing protein n=1 Tax=Anaerotruncus sp. 1XD42-93 TaxID=2320853 RepID=UPI0018F43A1F|nr:hypothetical protein [Anaerotruncus sp. 1XD42-93]
MDDNILTHYGVLGMKWGVRRTPAQLGRKKSSGGDKEEIKKAGGKGKVSSGNSGRKAVKDMTDAELKELISRLELEKRYRDLSKSEEQVRSAKGRDFVADVLEKSGKNIATQFTTYMMGTAVNKLAGSEIVNPKKGQKDK